MSEQEMVKVYELAKELGIDSISLLDKLKSLNIKVKNHMSDLKTEEVQIARSSLRRGSESEKKPLKKTPSKTRKKTGETSTVPPASVADQGAAEKRSASTVIRRRGRSDQTDGSTSVSVTITTARPVSESHPAEAASPAHSDPANVAANVMEAEHDRLPEAQENAEEIFSASDAESQDLIQESETQEVEAADQIPLDSAATLSEGTPTEKGASRQEEDQEAHPEAHLVPKAKRSTGMQQKPVSTSTQEGKSTSQVKTSILQTTSPTTGPTTGMEKKVSGTMAKSGISPSPSVSSSMTGAPSASSGMTSGMKGGVKTVNPPPAGASASGSSSPTASAPPKQRPPIIFTPRPVAPRRSILKIVEAAPPPPRPIIKPAPAPTPVKPAVKGTATQDKDGFRIIKMTKENLDQMLEEEAAKKRGGGREVELRPEDVRFADYRKKELVFLPKKKKIPIGKEIKKTEKTVSKAQKRIVEMHDLVTVQDLANQMSVKAHDVIRKLMGMGQMATINQSLDFDTATLIAHEYKYEVRNIAFNEQALIGAEADQEDQLVARPPVVTIMGHVDHGKTTLLDSIREANVAAGEAGGITQHIGAYTVQKNGKWITFIDTPGHEAFTVMRARGANVTDIVILVVAADDGVMPQTREALSHAQAAKVPIIVAVNKIDKPGANPEKIKQGLSELNLLAEDWGGDTMFIPVSALKQMNLDKLLDAVLLQAEMLDLKANPSVRASGTVLEARLEKGRGPVVSVLVNRGTLRVGDAIVAGPFSGKVKAMSDDKGKAVEAATPGTAVEILGFEGVPNAGEAFNSPENEAQARDIASNRIDKARNKIQAPLGKVSLEQLFSKIQAGDVKELNVVLKADAFGSVEAIRDSLVNLSTEKVKVKPILAAAGGISESDILLASASNAIVIGFNVRPETKARQLAEAEHVEVKCYAIIYELIDDVKKAMTGLLDKKKVEKFLGRAEVRQTFSVPKIGTVAGVSVIDGKILRGANVRLLRDSRILFDGKMSSLRRFKDDVKEVATGFECGIGIENYNDLKTGDIIEAYQIEMVTPELHK